jgi:hypothetical protein
MTPSIWLLIILLPFWIALVFFSMKRSFNMAALAVVPALALIALTIALPLEDDLALHRMALLRMTGIYMLLIGFLAAMGLMARYGVLAYRRNTPPPPPSGDQPTDGNSPPHRTHE